MLRVGQEEADAVRRVLESGKIFRYDADGECGRFERRYAEYIGTRQVVICSSGTNALTAALAGVGIGPGDEVLVPSHTYMATAVAVLAVGAIPVIVDIDESVTIDPLAVESSIGPRTRGVMPVHMWGQLCDMDAIMAIADRHDLLVVEDASQCIGGLYKGRAAGAIGHAGAYSFNFYKNMTCGEGGGITSHDEDVIKRARCMVDSCSFYWEGRDEDFTPFTNSSARASEFEGAILNVQLDRLPSLLESLRRNKARVVEATADCGLTLSPRHSPDGECATTLHFLLPSTDAAATFKSATSGGILAHTGRHNHYEWDPILAKQGSHHPALNPFTLPQNAECRMEYSKEMCPRSRDIVERTVMIGMSIAHTDEDLARIAETINSAAPGILAGA